jgi:putative membrane protein
MKRVIFYMFLIALVAFVRLIGCSPEKDPVNNTNELNEQMAEDKLTNRDVASFLVKSADARMMDAQEGWLATEKGSSMAVKRYGELMIKDQEELLSEIKKLAKKKNVALPPAISRKKERGRNNLADEADKDFDRKFIKMMTIDHERDVKLFRQATESKDADIRAFAKRYLPMIESHLEKIQTLKKARS